MRVEGHVGAVAARVELDAGHPHRRRPRVRRRRQVQTSQIADPAPNGASGYHYRSFVVTG